VWDPSRALSEPDRAILHLHLRHQLDDVQLGAALGVRPQVAAAQAARLRRRAETSVGALLLSRADSGADPDSCPRLAEVLDGWDGRFTPAVGARVDRHARRCETCRDRRTVMMERLNAMASLPFVPPPPWLRREVLIRMELGVSPRPLPGWTDDGFPPGIAGPARRRGPGPTTRRIAMAAVAAIVAAAGAFVLLRDDDGRSTVTASGSSASSVPTVATTVRAPATTAATVAPAVSTTVGPASTLPPTPSSTFVATQVPLAPPVDRDPPAISFGADVGSSYTDGCPYSRTGVSANVADQSPVTSVVLFVRGPDGAEEAMLMSPDGGAWRGSIGEFAYPGQAVFWVEAVDAEGNRARTADQFLQVLPCE